MDQARVVPVKMALLSFPVFFLGGVAFTLHGGPCAGECHTALFWRVALGGPVMVGMFTAALGFLADGLTHGGNPAPRHARSRARSTRNE